MTFILDSGMQVMQELDEHAFINVPQHAWRDPAMGLLEDGADQLNPRAAIAHSNLHHVIANIPTARRSLSREC
jgi:hypothetical protein